MGRIAEELADVVMVTSDNPRSEDPRKILREICGGMSRGEADSIIVEPDRASAIERAVQVSTAGDTILIAGKGHEKVQIIGAERIPFSDQVVAFDVMTRSHENRGGASGS